MNAPRMRGDGRLIRTAAALSLLLSSCTSTQPQGTSLRLQGLGGWNAIEAPLTQEQAADAVTALADRTPGGRPSSEGEALSGSRPGVHVSRESGRWADAVLRFGADVKDAAVPADPGIVTPDPTTPKALLVRRPHGTTGWQAVDLPVAEVRPAVAAMASMMRGDLVALLNIGPRALDAARRAAAATSEHRQVPAELIELESIEEVTWPNSALGLPQPGMVYAMALVPGHRVTLRLPGGLHAVVHTSARQALMAPNSAAPTPVALTPSPEPSR